MNRLKIQKSWFLVLNMSICLSFGYATVFNQFTAPSKVYAENLTEKTAEGDEKSSEQFNSFFIHEVVLELLLPLYDNSADCLMHIKCATPSFWPSPNTPPPDLA